MTASPQIQVDTSELKRPQAALSRVESGLQGEASPTLRQGGVATAEGLLALLRASARTSPTPQAVLVAGAAVVHSGGVIGVELGGGQGVGRRGSPAGELLWGSERGGPNFTAPHSASGYWIRPAVAQAERVGQEAYSRSINGLLSAAGLA
jgi:hypothetical protein